MRKTFAFLTLLLVVGCASSKPAPDPQPQPEAGESAPALTTLQGDTVPWDKVRATDKRTLLVFSTLW
ncbi:MAG: hypothetical protein IPK87_01325 [Planctomycetes bacterium]|nr:hypothetical protein [Planctomycetota bacterium]